MFTWLFCAFFLNGYIFQREQKNKEEKATEEVVDKDDPISETISVKEVFDVSLKDVSLELLSKKEDPKFDDETPTSSLASKTGAVFGSYFGQVTKKTVFFFPFYPF